MSRFFSSRYAALTPYTPGEQPQDQDYLKLNTNESPFPPSPGVAAAVAAQCGKLQLYSDPQCAGLRRALAKRYGVKPANIMVGNGSDEVLDLAFCAFAGEERPLYFADVTYGFYPVFAAKNRLPYEVIPLKEDFTIDPADYFGKNGVAVIANPNAPTGLALGLDAIEAILKANPDGVLIVDEAYVDFGAESAAALLDRYDNLLVVRTFSKSRSMAGARLGFAIGCEALIADLETLRYSTNPYNVNRMTLAAGEAALAEDDYYMDNCRRIAAIRDKVAGQLEAMGWRVLPSKTNFLFAASLKLGGKAMYQALRQKGVLVRHFDAPRTRDFIRITIGDEAQMERFVNTVKEIEKEAAQ
ncbi:histidinol-phosphate transaminase [Gemmiger sp. An194]|uniref:histidinol-phosphate transaminase n=1 Tax=Gemmiger sp. An194 TaxID=1965582 RepID=UPI000B37F373|nr:histidinol-phosphate transaminase [Gemmiger sp. An194]OUP23232.1 histidinol-phosphate transaminase [Gemmiger sp. An194]